VGSGDGVGVEVEVGVGVEVAEGVRVSVAVLVGVVTFVGVLVGVAVSVGVEEIIADTTLLQARRGTSRNNKTCQRITIKIFDSIPCYISLAEYNIKRLMSKKHAAPRIL
jgi:hypothetical protein